MSDFRVDLIQRFWKYEISQRFLKDNFLDRQLETPNRPPVFLRSETKRNVLINPDSESFENERILALIPDGERHKWYGSMNSSQALAQSILGNLAIYDKFNCLTDLQTDEKLPLLEKVDLSPNNFTMEHKINFLGEPRRTSLDGYISGDYQIAIECKFTEPEVGTCSRPRLAITASNYEREFCDGNYCRQRSRTERCSLTEIGVLYWRYIPYLFEWVNDSDSSPCPLNKNYQLVRNILAVGVKEDGTTSPNNGHVILLYDERNPAYQENGAGLTAYEETQNALKNREMLRKCSWQRIVKIMRDNNILPWLTDELSSKYGF